MALYLYDSYNNIIIIFMGNIFYHLGMIQLVVVCYVPFICKIAFQNPGAYLQFKRLLDQAMMKSGDFLLGLHLKIGLN